MKCVCKIEGCNDPARKLGWCLFHYDRSRYFGDPLAGPPRRRRHGVRDVCAVDGCEQVATGREFCAKHYSKFKAYGDPLGGKFVHSNHRRDWHVGHAGYVVRYEPEGMHAGPNGYVYQHRYVIGEKLGRKLKTSENVHHINGNKADNRPENLELWISAQPAGQRIEDLVSFARKILHEYGDLVERMALKL